MNGIAIGIAVILTYIYLSYYYRTPPIPKILQSDQATFNPELLLEKQPVILTQVPSGMTLPNLKKSLLPYHIPKALTSAPQWHRNSYKFLFIQPTESMEVHLLPAFKKITKEGTPSPEETLITLQLQPTQVLILPYRWLYYSDKPTQMMGLHDFVSWMLPA